MPIYEYNCSKCGNNFDILVRSNADLPKKCPACGAAKPRKALSAFAVTAKDPCNVCPSSSAGCPSAGHGCCGIGG